MRKLLFILLSASLVSAGCAFDGDSVQRLEEGQLQQARALARQNAVLEEHSTLLAQQIEAQQQTAGALARLEVKLERLRKQVASVRPSGRSGMPPASDSTLVVSPEGKIVLGRNEWAWLDLLGRTLKARIDTGAKSSSLNAVDLQPFERDGKEWIRFRVPDESHPDGGEMYETALVRHVRIRQASAEELERRPVVKLKVRVGELVEETEFSLTNRQNMLYPLLLGRNFLRDIAIVDVARKFVQEKYTAQPAETSE